MKSVEIYRTITQVSSYQGLTKVSLQEQLYRNVMSLIDYSDVNLRNPKQSRVETYKLLLTLLHVKVVSTVYLQKSYPKYTVDMNRREELVYGLTVTNGIDTLDLEVMEANLMSLPKQNPTIDVQFTYSLRESFLEVMLEDGTQLVEMLQKVRNGLISIETMYEPYKEQVYVMPTIDMDWQMLMDKHEEEKA